MNVILKTLLVFSLKSVVFPSGHFFSPVASDVASNNLQCRKQTFEKPRRAELGLHLPLLLMLSAAPGGFVQVKALDFKMEMFPQLQKVPGPGLVFFSTWPQSGLWRSPQLVLEISLEDRPRISLSEQIDQKKKPVMGWRGSP